MVSQIEMISKYILITIEIFLKHKYASLVTCWCPEIKIFVSDGASKYFDLNQNVWASKHFDLAGLEFCQILKTDEPQTLTTFRKYFEYRVHIIQSKNMLGIVDTLGRARRHPVC